MSQENVEIVRDILAANRSGPDDETTGIVLALTDPKVEFRSRITAVEGADYHGHEGVRRYHDDMADAFRAWRNEAAARHPPPSERQAVHDPGRPPSARRSRA